MAKNNYQLGQAKMGAERRGGPGGRMAVAEKPKDMKGAIKNILRYLNRFIPQVATALVCSVTSVMLSGRHGCSQEDRNKSTCFLCIQRLADMDTKLYSGKCVQICHEGHEK